MPRARRKIAFVLAASDHGAMIVNRFDYRLTGNDAGIGVGYQILEHSSYDISQVETVLRLLDLRRQYHGAGVINRQQLMRMLSGRGYRQFTLGLNVLAVHEADRTGAHISVSETAQPQGGTP